MTNTQLKEYVLQLQEKNRTHVWESALGSLFCAGLSEGYGRALEDILAEDWEIRK